MATNTLATMTAQWREDARAHKRHRLHQYLCRNIISMRTLSEDEFLEFASLLDPAYCKRAWYGWIEIDQSPSSKLYYHSQLLFIGTYEEACERFWPTTTVPLCTAELTVRPDPKRQVHDVTVDTLSGVVHLRPSSRLRSMEYAGGADPYITAYPAVSPFEYRNALEEYPLPFEYSLLTPQLSYYRRLRDLRFTILPLSRYYFEPASLLFFAATDHYINPTLYYRQNRIILARIALALGELGDDDHLEEKDQVKLPEEWRDCHMFVAMIKERALTHNYQHQAALFSAWYGRRFSFSFLRSGQMNSIDRLMSSIRNSITENSSCRYVNCAILLLKLLSPSEFCIPGNARSVPAFHVHDHGSHELRKKVGTQALSSFTGKLLRNGGVEAFGRGLRKLGMLGIVARLEEVD